MTPLYNILDPPLQGSTQKSERGVSKFECEILLINIYDIHTIIHMQFASQTCGVLVSRGIGAESPCNADAKVLVLHADT